MIKKNKLLFIDGITRSGKSSICQTIVALKNVEHVDLNYDFEYLFAGLVNKKIDLDYAKNFFDSSFSRYTYDRVLGRNLNLKKADFTSIFNSYDPKIYLDRIKSNKFKHYHYKKTTNKKNFELDETFNFLKSNHLYFPIQTHYLLENYGLLKKLDLNYKLIRLNRHPVDLIYSYYKRGWGKIIKYNMDHPYKYASYCKKKNGILIPWFVDISERKYKKLNEINRCIFSVISNLKKIRKKNYLHTHVVNFDLLCKNPNTEFKKICKFLNVKKQKKLNSFLLRANFPRKINEKDRQKKYAFLISKSKDKRLIYSLNHQIKIFENTMS